MAESSFDVVCKIDGQELANAIDMTRKEIDNRFDFKGIEVDIKHEKDSLKLEVSSEMHMNQVIDVLKSKLIKRDINLKAFSFGEFESNVSGKVKCLVSIQNGLSQDQCKKINKLIKDSKLKVQSRVQGDSVRVSGKSRDDLQNVQKIIKEADFDFDTSFDNYR